MASNRTEKPTEEVDEVTELDPKTGKKVQLSNKPVRTKPESTENLSGKYIRHLPLSMFSARVITKEDWVSIGVLDQDGVEWNEQNHFILPVEMFSPSAVAYLSNDKGFEAYDPVSSKS